MLSDRESEYTSTNEALSAETPPFLVPAATLGELDYLLERRATRAKLTRFLTDIEIGRFTLDCGEHDHLRIAQLIERYADLNLGLVDAAVKASGGRVLTLDLRHFGVVAREGRITLVP